LSARESSLLLAVTLETSVNRKALAKLALSVLDALVACLGDEPEVYSHFYFLLHYGPMISMMFFYQTLVASLQMDHM
jgi:hypothetical protein